MVAIANSPDPVATASQFLKSGEPHVRSATATAIREIIRRVEAGPWISPLNGLLASNEQAAQKRTPKRSHGRAANAVTTTAATRPPAPKCGDRPLIRIFTINEDPDQDNNL
jgi:hypothetical protein